MGTSLNENDDVEDTSCVLLADLPLFNDDISAWDTSRVTTMEKMFKGQSAFNQPLGDWQVDNVTNMSEMFHGATSFNHPIGGWRVHNVWNMRSMFQGAESMTEPNVLYSSFKWFQPTRGRLADQWWADKEEMEKDKERPRWQLGDPTP